jgi:hypothetical protein
MGVLETRCYMVFAMQQPIAYRATLALGSALFALACGGKVSDVTDGVAAQGGNPATGDWSAITTGGAMGMAGTLGFTLSATGGTKATGGAPAVSTMVASNCRELKPPTATGSLSITSGYVTSGLLRGYGFTWLGDKSTSNTCIVPVCSVTGCTPAFGTTALCAAGVVDADAAYNSVAGVGFNLNQASTGGSSESIPAPTTVTVAVTFYGDLSALNANRGNAAARVQLLDAGGVAYCVDTGAWVSDSPIDITHFNTTCWDESLGVPLTSGTPIQSIHLIVPADATTNRRFSFCLTGVTFS